jgi:hypothetical protein
MRKRDIAALLATVIFGWPTGGSRLFAPPFASTSSSIFVLLAQEGGMAGGYSTGGSVGGSAGGPVTTYGASGQLDEGSAACAGKSAGDSCSFAVPDGQTVNGTCRTIPIQLVCVPAGATFHSERGKNGSQPEGDR